MYGKAIKTYLDERGIKYSFAAKEAGIPSNIFSVILNEKRKITVDEFFKICSVLGTEPNYFYFAAQAHPPGGNCTTYRPATGV